MDYHHLDIYVLVNTRSAEFVQRFLREFGVVWEEASAEYIIPEFSSEPQVIFSKAADVMRWAEANVNETHRIYWTNLDEQSRGKLPQNAMVFYTDDGQMVFGLTCYVSDDNWEHESEMWLRRLKNFASSEIGYITVEEPPPDSAREFMKIVDRVAENS